MRMDERMARALATVIGDLGLAPAGGWPALPVDEQERYRFAARKLIAAFRTPTRAMLAEGDRRDMPHDAANIWERMVFVALHEDAE